MFAYILKAPSVQNTEQTDEFFRRFTQTPGLLHAFDLQGVDDPNDQLVVAVWESKAAAERYLNSDPLRKEADQAIAGITRTMYNVLNAK